ncbi:unnamed protein product [Pedinophyceae sp. YPF-701]|nr:unnamed protein product [Pedinophyceae sp. YPF-701]
MQGNVARAAGADVTPAMIDRAYASMLQMEAAAGANAKVLLLARTQTERLQKVNERLRKQLRERDAAEKRIMDDAARQQADLKAQLARKDDEIRSLKRRRDDADAAHKAEIEAERRERDAHVRRRVDEEVRRRVQEGLRRGFESDYPGISDGLRMLTPAVSQPQQSPRNGAAQSLGATHDAAQQLAAFRAERVANNEHAAGAAGPRPGRASPGPPGESGGARDAPVQLDSAEKKDWLRVLDYGLLARLLSLAVKNAFTWKGKSALVNRTQYSEVPDAAWTSAVHFAEEYPHGRTRLPCLVKCLRCQWRNAELCFHPPTEDEPWRLPGLLGDDAVVTDPHDRALVPRDSDGRKHDVRKLLLDAIKEGKLGQADLNEATAVILRGSEAPQEALDRWIGGSLYLKMLEAFTDPSAIAGEGSPRSSDGDCAC